MVLGGEEEIRRGVRVLGLVPQVSSWPPWPPTHDAPWHAQTSFHAWDASHDGKKTLFNYVCNEYELNLILYIWKSCEPLFYLCINEWSLPAAYA